MYGFGLNWVVLVMCFVGRLTEVKGCKQRENVGLQEGYQEFDQVHENHEERGKRPSTETDASTELLSENEDERGERQNDDVPGRNVGRQTDHEDRRLDENARDLDRNENELDGQGYA